MWHGSRAGRGGPGQGGGILEHLNSSITTAMGRKRSQNSRPKHITTTTNHDHHHNHHHSFEQMSRLIQPAEHADTAPSSQSHGEQGVLMAAIEAFSFALFSQHMIVCDSA